MEEINNIFSKYNELSFNSSFKTEEELNKYIIQYCNDLSELVDLLSHLINNETHPNYYNLNEATIVGSITRIIKLYKEIIHNYELNKSEILALFVRPFYESFIISKYLIRNGEESQRNFRIVSYKSRFDNFKILNNQNNLIIKRQLFKLNAKLKEDGFTISDLEKEDKKSQKWKLDGKSFWKIHSEVDFTEMYSFIYGVGSDSVHGNWQEIIDFHLTEKGKGYFGFLNYEKCDCRAVITINTILIESILEFLEWNNCSTDKIEKGLKSMLKINQYVYPIWEEKFGETIELNS